jgi:hypothetical protein
MDSAPIVIADDNGRRSAFTVAFSRFIQAQVIYLRTRKTRSFPEKILPYLHGNQNSLHAPIDIFMISIALPTFWF